MRPRETRLSYEASLKPYAKEIAALSDTEESVSSISIDGYSPAENRRSHEFWSDDETSQEASRRFVRTLDPIRGSPPMLRPLSTCSPDEMAQRYSSPQRPAVARPPRRNSAESKAEPGRNSASQTTPLSTPPSSEAYNESPMIKALVTVEPTHIYPASASIVPYTAPRQTSAKHDAPWQAWRRSIASNGSARRAVLTAQSELRSALLAERCALSPRVVSVDLDAATTEELARNAQLRPMKAQARALDWASRADHLAFLRECAEPRVRTCWLPSSGESSLLVEAIARVDAQAAERYEATAACEESLGALYEVRAQRWSTLLTTRAAMRSSEMQLAAHGCHWCHVRDPLRLTYCAESTQPHQPQPQPQQPPPPSPRALVENARQEELRLHLGYQQGVDGRFVRVDGERAHGTDSKPRFQSRFQSSPQPRHEWAELHTVPSLHSAPSPPAVPSPCTNHAMAADGTNQALPSADLAQASREDRRAARQVARQRKAEACAALVAKLEAQLRGLSSVAALRE